MDISHYPTTWHGQEALVLESSLARLIVIPGMGGKLVSLVDKRSGSEWLVGPGTRSFQPVAYGAPFTEQDMSGWDEMFPTIAACRYPGPGEHNGVDLPDHGEVWTMAWETISGEKEAIELSIRGKVLPYRLTRRIHFSAPDILRLDYTLLNEGSERMPYLWAAHPQFICGKAARVVLPEEVDGVINVLPAEWGWGDPGQEYPWPEAILPDGQTGALDRVGPPSLEKARKFFVPPHKPIQWAAITREPGGDWLRMAWNPEEIPYFGVWVDEGVFSHASAAAPEPMTGYYDSLETAVGTALVEGAEPGIPRRWTLSVQIGTGAQPLPKN